MSELYHVATPHNNTGLKTVAFDMRRIWLQDVGIFEIVPNSGNGSCLFQALSQALTYSTEHHHKIRKIIVDHMTSKQWTEKLKELPEFWKHKIVTTWLEKEVRSINQQSTDIFSGLFKNCFCKWLQVIIERRKHNKYQRIERLLRRKSKPYSEYMEDFKFAFQKFMSEVHEPATRFELEAAANKFRFHFDYLQAMPVEANQLHFSKIDLNATNDLLNNNMNDQTSIESDGGSEKPEQRQHVSPVKMAMFQFYSCRNRGCKLPRSCPTYEHFYFLHSPLAFQSISTDCDKKDQTLNEDSWHWELLIPIKIR